MAFVVAPGVPARAVVIPLGNLFDDPTTETLANAIASDTFEAQAGVGDLGVYTTIYAGLASPATIAPGVSFDFTNLGADNGAFRPIFNDSAYGGGSIIRTTGVAMSNYTQPGLGNGEEQGIGMHTNQAMTFDLNALRTAGGLDGYGFTFTADGGLNDDTTSSVNVAVLVSDASGVVAGFVNGQQVAVSQSGSYYFSGTLPGPVSGRGHTNPFNVSLSSTDLYLTLATLAYDGIGSDQAVFSMAQLTSVAPPPAPEPTSATLLLCGLAIIFARKGNYSNGK
jgi:hypothetical protein